MLCCQFNHWVGSPPCVQMGHHGFFHVSLPGMVYIWLHSTQGCPGWHTVFFKTWLCCGLVHPRIHDDIHFLVGTVGPYDKLENWPLPAALWGDSRGDPRCVTRAVWLRGTDRRITNYVYRSAFKDLPSVVLSHGICSLIYSHGTCICERKTKQNTSVVLAK